MDAITAAVETATTDLGFVILDPDAFARAKAISVDYAVMEKTKRAAVLPVSFGWSDVGSWEAIWQLASKDADGNAIARQGGSVLDSSGSYVFSEKRWSRCLALTISWLWRPKTPSWSRGATASTA